MDNNLNLCKAKLPYPPIVVAKPNKHYAEIIQVNFAGAVSEFSQTAVCGLLCGCSSGGVSAAAAVAAGCYVLDRAGPARPRHDHQLPSDRAVYRRGHCGLAGPCNRRNGAGSLADHLDGRSAGLGGHGRHDALELFQGYAPGYHHLPPANHQAPAGRQTAGAANQ